MVALAGWIPHYESAIVACPGRCCNGLRPVAEIMFMDFVGVTMDQIYNQAARCAICSAEGENTDGHKGGMRRGGSAAAHSSP